MIGGYTEEHENTVTVYPLGGEDFTIPSADFEDFCKEELEKIAESMERQGDTDTARSIENTINAARLMKAIKRLAKDTEAADNFESYLSRHFDKWIEKWVTTPAGMASEFENFANMFMF